MVAVAYASFGLGERADAIKKGGGGFHRDFLAIVFGSIGLTKKEGTND